MLSTVLRISLIALFLTGKKKYDGMTSLRLNVMLNDSFAEKNGKQNMTQGPR